MAKIAKSPAHHAVNRWYQTTVNLRSQRLAMGIDEDRPRASGFAVKQAFRHFGVEPHPPSTLSV